MSPNKKTSDFCNALVCAVLVCCSWIKEQADPEYRGFSEWEKRKERMREMREMRERAGVVSNFVDGASEQDESLRSSLSSSRSSFSSGYDVVDGL